MKRLLTVMALVALASCESATSSGRETQANDGVKAPTAGPSMGGGAAGEPHRAVIASVRKKTTGSPSTYEAFGLAVDGNGVYVEVRSSSTGFSTLTSGTLVNGSSGTGETSVSFNATSGTRYLVVAYPANGSLVDIVHPSFMEAVP